MRGEVIYVDYERGTGFIGGDDGNRYHFSREDCPPGSPVRKGARVEFTAEQNRARGVTLLERRQAVPQVALAEGAVSAANVAAVSPPVAGAGNRSLWAYFVGAMTAGYADFRGRARRKEYWGLVLFTAIGQILVMLAGLTVDLALGNIDAETPIVTGLASLGFLALCVVPLLSVTVRRIHDIGLSGWFVLLGFVPSVGNLIILVFALIPSQKHENRWGDVPEGAL